MKVYVTYGTYDYLLKIKEENNEEMFLLVDDDGAELYHQTASQPVFKSGKEYDILDQKGNVTEPRFVVLNHIPVEESERPTFEDRFKNRAGKVENEPGCEGIRILRPVDPNDPYIVATFWRSEDDFKNWQSSEAYNTAHKHRNTDKGLPKTVFRGKPYVKTYHVDSPSV
ncbi:antibiotic biosynthesis monooxygenase family protein [Alkalihalobacillus sp. CinArs1]|uniref:antibiotic biosynthesis monooxygenase family protein n=1 Tax=Alkalihalobacillus sp. CinArs1 TaxID=2995314 RepID=UPI0022DD41E7|nr:antibiotic biosynthesis monooxygenase [Alkalihalobacillus sp. CinArs1]